MVGTVGRKVQAFADLLYPGIDIAMHRIGLFPRHVEEYGLPSTPLKAGESRADAWTEATGVLQTELDAMVVAHPDALAGMVAAKLDPYFDHTLERRIGDAEEEYRLQVQAILDERTTPEQRSEMRERAGLLLDGMREQIELLNRESAVSIDASELPDVTLPEADIDQTRHEFPIFATWMPYVDGTDCLKDDRAYGGADQVDG
jgi:hypothetical protein